MDLNIKVETKTDEIIVKPEGEIDICFAPAFKEKLNNIIIEKKVNLLIDCEKLDYLDSTGLGALMSILKNANENNVKIVIVNLKPNIRKLFSITGLDKIFSIK